MMGDVLAGAANGETRTAASFVCGPAAGCGLYSHTGGQDKSAR